MGASLGARQARVGALGPLQATEATYTLTPDQRVVHVDTTANTVAITLPPAQVMEGAIIFISFKVDGANDLTVTSPEESAIISLTFADAADRLAVISSGYD